MKKIYVVLFGIFFVTTNLLSQAPNWTVNPNDYENSMAVVAVVLLNGTELTSINTKVGAFVDSNLRGVANTSSINSDGKHVAHILIWSNVGAGETVTFKVYDSVEDAVYQTVNTLEFLNNAKQGNSASPYIVKDNNSPTGIELSDNSVDENLEIATVIGQFSSVDIDLGDTFTYTLVVGEGDQNNTAFTIENNNLKTAQSFNYESNDTYSVRIQTTDTRNGIFSSQFTVSIGDVNDAPTDISISDNAVDENVEIGSLLAELSTTDEDISDTFTYSLIAGDGSEDNASFIIEESNLKTNASINFEQKNSYSIRIQTEDNEGKFFSKPFVIAINDLNDLPTDISLAAATFNENQEIGSLIAGFITTDQDPSDVHLYSFLSTGSNDNEDFAIIDNQLFTKSTFDFEERKTYFINVKSNDQKGGTIEQLLTLNIIDQNDAPTELKLSNTTIEENKPLGTIVGILETADQDTADTFTYSLVAGIGSDDNTSFQIIGNELQSNVIFEYEPKQFYTIRIKTTDTEGLAIENSFFIEILNENDIPSDIILDNTTVLENLAIGVVIGELTTLDEDQTDSHFYSFASGDNDNNLFSLLGNKLLTKKIFDYETSNEYIVLLETNDKRGGTFPKSFTINIIDVNEQPEIANQEFSVLEGSIEETVIGVVEASDIDEDALVFTLLDENVPFEINTSTGEISISVLELDYEQASSYEFAIQVTDPDGLFAFALITILVDDIIESGTPLSANDFISANDDGYNDTFFIQNVSLYQDFTLIIYNNAGIEVFSMTGYDNTWSGTDNSGRELAAGAYYYSLISPSNPISFEGSLTLVR